MFIELTGIKSDRFLIKQSEIFLIMPPVFDYLPKLDQMRIKAKEEMNENELQDENARQAYRDTDPDSLRSVIYTLNEITGEVGRISSQQSVDEFRIGGLELSLYDFDGSPGIYHTGKLFLREWAIEAVSGAVTSTWLETIGPDVAVCENYDYIKELL